MTLEYICENIDKSKENEYCGSDMMTFAQTHFHWFYGEWIWKDSSERLKAYYIKRKECYSADVGARIYFLDDKAVAVEWKNSKKSDEVIRWLSVESFEKMKEYAKEFINHYDEEEMKLADLQEDWGSGYSLKYNEEVLKYHNDKYLYRGEKVKVVAYAKDNYINEKVLVELSDGTQKEMLINDLVLEYHLTKKENNETK